MEIVPCQRGGRQSPSGSDDSGVHLPTHWKKPRRIREASTRSTGKDSNAATTTPTILFQRDSLPCAAAGVVSSMDGQGLEAATCVTPLPFPTLYIFPKNSEGFDVWPVHRGPGIACKQTGQLLLNTRFTLLAIESKWGRLRLSGGTEGWSPLEYRGRSYLVPFVTELHGNLKQLRRQPSSPKGPPEFVACNTQADPRASVNAGPVRVNSGSKLLGYFFGTREDDTLEHKRQRRGRSGGKSQRRVRSGEYPAGARAGVVARRHSQPMRNYGRDKESDCSDAVPYRKLNGMLPLPAPPVKKLVALQSLLPGSAAGLDENSLRPTRYSWERMRGRAHDEFVAILETRRDELRAMNLETDRAALAEWLELLKERDIILRYKFKTRVVSQSDVRKPRSLSFLASSAVGTTLTDFDTKQSSPEEYGAPQAFVSGHGSVDSTTSDSSLVKQNRRRSNSFISRTSDAPVSRSTLIGQDIVDKSSRSALPVHKGTPQDAADHDSGNLERTLDGELPGVGGATGRSSTRSSSSHSTPVLALPTPSSSDDDVLDLHQRSTPPLPSNIIAPSPCGSPRRDIGKSAAELARERGFVAVKVEKEHVSVAAQPTGAHMQAVQYDSESSDSPLPASSSSVSPYSQPSEPGSPATSADEMAPKAVVSETSVRCVHGGNPQTCRYGSCPALATASDDHVSVTSNVSNSSAGAKVEPCVTPPTPIGCVVTTALATPSAPSKCIHGFAKNSCKYGSCFGGGGLGADSSSIRGGPQSSSKCEHGFDPSSCKYGACPDKVNDRAVFEAMVQEELEKLRLAEGSIQGMGGISDTEGYTLSEAPTASLVDGPVGRTMSDQASPCNAATPSPAVAVTAFHSGSVTMVASHPPDSTLKSGTPQYLTSPAGTVSPTGLALTGATRKLTRKRKVKSRTSMSPMVSTGRASVGAVEGGSSAVSTVMPVAPLSVATDESPKKVSPIPPQSPSPTNLDSIASDGTLCEPQEQAEVLTEQPVLSSQVDTVSTSEDDTPERAQGPGDVCLPGSGDHSIIKRSLLSDFNDDIAAGKADWL
eukprot:m.497153 g.497153  ORF g.497153 m.497153 type:complete len:1046 (-) comp21814_c0_seq1:226-3363(-)